MIPDFSGKAAFALTGAIQGLGTAAAKVFSAPTQGGIGYAKMILEKELGPEEANLIINRLTSSLQVKPFDFARKADPNQILNFIQNEHPQTIALILSYFHYQLAQLSFLLVSLVKSQYQP